MNLQHNPEKGYLFIVSGPSGVGKTVLCNAIVEKFAPEVVYSISTTSRAPRGGETDGQEYNFCSSQKFEESEILEKIERANQKFGIENGDQLVEQISRTLLPYDNQKQPIFLLKRDGRKIKLEDAETQILSAHINQPTTKNILFFPREI